MSILLMDSFSTYNNINDLINKYNINDTIFNVFTSAGRHGQNATTLGGTGLTFNTPPILVNDLSISVMLKITDNTQTEDIIKINSNSNSAFLMLFTVITGGLLKVQGSRTEIVPNILFKENIWHRLEVTVNRDNNNPKFIIKFDGNTVADYTNMLLKQSLSTQIDNIIIRSGAFLLNDLLITQNDGVDMIAPPTDFTIEKLHANGTVTNNFSVFGSGNAHNAVLSNDGDTTYVKSTAINDVIDIDLSTLSSNIDSIYAVESVVTGKQEDTFNQQITTNIAVGGNLLSGTTKFLPLTYDTIFDVFETKPGGGGWTPAAVDSLRVKISTTI